MREAINNNPIVQIGLLGVLGVIVVVVLMSNMGGDPPPAEETETTPSTPTTTAPAAPNDSSGLAAPTATAPEAVSGVAASTPFEAGKGLPSELVNAHESGDVVVLLVMQSGGVEDESLKKDVESLESRGDTSVFVTDAKRVSKFSRIAEGVSLDRVPAIIVLHPLEGKLAGGEAPPLPEASIAYGYRGEESVVQAVNDALYDGGTGPYSP